MKVSDALFKEKAATLASILQQRYAIELGKKQTLQLNGMMTISGSWLYKLFL